VKGFPSAQRCRHLRNMLVGNVYEVNCIFARDLKASSEANEDYLKLKVRGKDSPDDTIFLVGGRVVKI
jgi:GrpB-like predicted nucleotidyltransferase (UPF0157 family)